MRPEIRIRKTAHRGRFAPCDCSQCVGRLLSRSRHGPTRRQPFQHTGQVERTHHLKKPVRRIAAGPDHFGRSIGKGDSPLPTERLHRFPVEMPSVRSDEPLTVAVKHQSHHTPHIVLEIGIVELHRPARTGRRKTAEHQQPCPLRQKRFEGVRFGHPPAGGLFPVIDHMIKTLLILCRHPLRCKKNERQPASFSAGPRTDVSDERYPTGKQCTHLLPAGYRAGARRIPVLRGRIPEIYFTSSRIRRATIPVTLCPSPNATPRSLKRRSISHIVSSPIPTSWSRVCNPSERKTAR